ncbi:MAG: lysoplasmalogenase [Sediminibacterium sp.]|nr:lysoplasmalogenase [Sediminibacterium sp.]
MQLIKKHGIALFLLVLAIHCLCIYGEWALPRIFTKLLLVPLLMACLWTNTRHTSTAALAGLGFSFAGDLLLARSGESFFLLGMLAFMGTHISNSLYFIRQKKIETSRPGAMLLAAGILTVVIFLVLRQLGSSLGNFKAPILVYMIVISAMAILAANTITSFSLRAIAIACFIPGAALFVLSDALLAMNKFLYHQPLLDIAVMLTYGGAQYFLVAGFIRAGKKTQV